MRTLTVARPGHGTARPRAFRLAAVAVSSAALTFGLVASPAYAAVPQADKCKLEQNSCDEDTIPAPEPDYHRTKANINQPISSQEALVRTKDWLDRQVPYSQTASAPDLGPTNNYRTDCSGLVSMSWHTQTSYTTMSLPEVSKQIDWGQVMPGDALLKDGHVVSVVKPVSGGFLIREHYSTPLPPRERTLTMGEAYGSGYHPIRYDKLQVVTPEVARKEIEKVLPKIKVSLEPPDLETFTNLPTIFYSGAKPFHETVHMVNGSVPVEVWAEPQRYHWNFGDGHEHEGTDPGKPYPNQTITHKYEKTGVYHPTVNVTWGNLRYRLPGENTVHTLDDRPTTLGQFNEVRVIQAKSVLGEDGER